MARPFASAPAVRSAAVAGSFYPAGPDRLAASIDALLAEAPPVRLPGRLAALVVPHAGYLYSGPVAARGWSTLRGIDPRPARIAIAGPAHFVPLRGAAVPAARWWRTPLGDVEIDGELRAIAEAAGARIDDRPHEPEHALEVQLPFVIRCAVPGARVLPIAVGEGRPAGVADLLERLAGPGAAELIAVSTDLSHYLDDAAARRVDGRTIAAILALDPEAIDDLDACGAHALRGLVELARRRGWTATLLDQRTSADAGGDRLRVVGYAAVAFT